MRKENGYWIDENNNKWNCDFYSEKKAEEKSKTLINCRDCSGCSDCSYCSDCSGCSYCRDCSGCSGCSGCSYCSYCSDCSYCSGCSGCSGYEQNPQRYVTAKLGSRNSQTTFYYDGKDIFVVCGCFKGNLDAFEKRVKKTYTDENNEHRIAYDKEIKKVKELFF